MMPLSALEAIAMLTGLHCKDATCSADNRAKRVRPGGVGLSLRQGCGARGTEAQPVRGRDGSDRADGELFQGMEPVVPQG